MASLDILCSNPLKLKNEIIKIEHEKIFCGPLKILKNLSWPINICPKYFMTPTKILRCSRTTILDFIKMFRNSTILQHFDTSHL